jgi:hypothetical protein
VTISFSIILLRGVSYDTRRNVYNIKCRIKIITCLTQKHDPNIRESVFDKNILGGMYDLKITEPAAAKIHTSSIY